MGCAFCKRSKKIAKYDVSDLSPDWHVTMLKEVEYYQYLKDDECDILVNKWRQLMEDPNTINFGNIVFAKFFLYAPDAQKLFFHDPTKIRSTYQWQRHPLFLSHIRRVVSGIDTAISLLRYPQDFEHHLNHIRKVHLRYGDMKVFYAEIFIKVFEDCIAQAVGEMYTKECKNAFRKFLIVLYSVLFRDWERSKCDRPAYRVAVTE
ncbi:hypothetical protein BsWGS_10922 [Bradybaena similaris]